MDRTIDNGADSLEGSFLISTARTGEFGIFDRAVILLCTHGPDGAMGLIVNNQFPKPTVADLFRELDIKSEVDLSGIGVHCGGPVERGRGFILHGADYVCEGSTPVTSDIYLTLAQTILGDLAIGRGPDRYLVAMGYAGWASDQLQEEIARNMWITGPADADIVFGSQCDEKWNLALERIGISPSALAFEGGSA